MGAAAGRRLIVMRHGRAGDLPGRPDAERALTPRGQHDAAAAGRWLRDSGDRPGQVLCSPARRARQTWRGVAAELGAPAGPDAPGGLDGEMAVSIEPRLYEASADDLTGLLAAATAPTVMYVGHNPAARDLVCILTGEPREFPPAAIAVIGLTVPWTDLAVAEGELIALWRPPLGR